MSTNQYDLKNIDVAWCPGCGNFAIHKAVKKTLDELDVPQQNLVMVSGIGQAAKTPQYMKCHYFNGLHGRSLPVATGIKAANPRLTVVVESGDGCMYGEGGNHFVHAIRRNPDVTCLVHNNMIYGLTKGQASPTSPMGLETPVQVHGNHARPFNPLSVALALGATFVARAFCVDIEKTSEIIRAAVQHNGFALVDIFQPCITFNKINTFKWFKENTYHLSDKHDRNSISEAFKVAMKTDKFGLGILYQGKEEETFEDGTCREKENQPLWQAKRDMKKVRDLVSSYSI